MPVLLPRPPSSWKMMIWDLVGCLTKVSCLRFRGMILALYRSGLGFKFMKSCFQVNTSVVILGRSILGKPFLFIFVLCDTLHFLWCCSSQFWPSPGRTSKAGSPSGLCWPPTTRREACRRQKLSQQKPKKSLRAKVFSPFSRSVRSSAARCDKNWRRTDFVSRVANGNNLKSFSN